MSEASCRPRRSHGAIIARVDAGAPGVGADGNVVYRHAPHAFIDLRPTEPRATETYTELRGRAVSAQFHLTAFGPRGSQWTSRNSDGLLAGDIVSKPQQPRALCFTQLYKRTGALYGINQAIVADDGTRSFIATERMRSDFIRTLQNYLDFYRLNADLAPPLRLYAGFEMLDGLYLAVSSPTGTQFVGPATSARSGTPWTPSPLTRILGSFSARCSGSSGTASSSRTRTRRSHGERH